MKSTLYRIRSQRDGQPEPGEAALLRESYGCLERSDCTLFLWRDAQGAARRLQFLFGERYLEWSDDRGWIAGDTNRGAGPQGAPGRGKGVRTLHGRRAAPGDAILGEGLALLQGATLPAELDGLLPALLADSELRGETREH